jgi:hypothetical protein
MEKATLIDPPQGERAREIWLNHAIGYTLMRDVRDYARERIDPNLPEEARSSAIRAIDDAVYGLMMVLDGVPTRFQNERYSVALESEIVLYDGDEDIIRTNFFEGFCMGYHSWIEGDFGDDPIATPERQ